MLSSYNYFELGDNYVSIDGTWASQSEEELGNSFQTVKFTCDKEEGTCQQVVADTVFGILSLFTEVSRVTSWDKNFITAETSGVCVIYKYRIDRLQKELVGIRQTINHEGVCAVVSQDDLKIKLVDGVKKVLKLRGY